MKSFWATRAGCALLVAGAASTAFAAAAASQRGEQPLDPAHFFASREGLIRVYQARSAGAGAAKAKAKAGAGAAASLAPGASCEVVDSRPSSPLTIGSLRERCTMVVARKPRTAALLTYELRPSGIFLVRSQLEEGRSDRLERLMLPAPLRAGQSWSEDRAGSQLRRTVRSAGTACRAAGRAFGDCLVLTVAVRSKGKTLQSYEETYAAGVGLVQDAQWQLIDLTGL